ncbi:CBS domain-containing protein [Rosistilla oblonga]|uniref:CBS domain-containing protein n=1 Tax=Rosistilla oblonga TaxID=2527990 RepID=UPI00119E1301|nr:CBS domain-containing protein [Rosistilla oblonga]
MSTPRLSSVMLNGQLPKFAEHIIAGMIMTPVDQLVVASPADSLAHALEKMGATFDQLPVIHQGTLAGMLFRDRIPNSGDGQIADIFSPLSTLDSILSSESMLEAIECLVRSPCCIVFDAESGGFAGLLHYADLNRQAVRLFCYLWTSALEMSLAELLTMNQPDDMSWIESLAQHRQVQVLGRHEYGRRQNIELSPVEGLELSDLLNIWPKQERLLNLFAMSKSEFKKKTNHLVELRNAAMHPVRSLLNGHAEVAVFQRRMHDLREMVRKSVTLIQENGVDGAC